MRYILKRAFAAALAGIIALVMACAAAGAEEIYKGDFLRDEYVFLKENDDNIKDTSFDVPLPGKTKISFEFSIESGASFTITAQEYESGAQREILSFQFSEADEGFSLNGVNYDGAGTVIARGIKSGKTYCADIQADLNEGTYNAAVYKGSGKSRLLGYVKNISLGNGFSECGIKSISGSVGMNRLTICRERAAGDTPVISMSSGIVSVGTKIRDNVISDGKAYDVYAVFYNDDTQIPSFIQMANGVYKSYDDYIEVFFSADEKFRSVCDLALFVFREDNICPLSDKGKAKLNGGGVVPESFFRYTSFEENESYKDKTTDVVCQKLPENWGAQSWNGPDKPFNIDFVDNGRGGRTASLEASSSGFYGLTAYLSSPPSNGFSISFDIKCSEDYSGNVPKIVVIYFDKNWKTLRSDFSQLSNVSSDKWKNESIYVSPSDYPEDSAKIQIAFCTVYTSGTASGTLYYDSLCIDSKVFEMKCTEKLSWYKTGETVCYKPSVPLCGEISEITGSVYNSDGVLTDKLSVSAAEASENGWRYTPEKSGYYKVVFEALADDGRLIYEHKSYKAYYDDNTKTNMYIEKACHDFYVTAYEKRDFDQRNKLYGMSIGNYDGEYDLDIADCMGMSFLRLHAFSWKDIEPEDVTPDNGKEYNWAEYDKIFNRMRDDGLEFDVIGNILYTPKWASLSNDESGTMVPQYASYAPSDMTYLTDFIKDLYERYGDYINTWEIYNEPHLPGGSVFWRDTPDNYVELLRNAYNEIKRLSNNSDEVDMGGIGAKRYLSFYRQFLDKGGSSYTDKLVMHGYDLDPWNYLNINSQLGLSDMEVINTEAHMILFNGSSDSVYFTEKELGLRMIKEYLKQIKYGVKRIAFFQPYDNSVQGEDLMILDNLVSEWNWTTVAAGLFRKKPYWEPRFAAGALNTLIAETGSVTEYADEYKTGNVNIVKLMADGEPLYVLWCDELEEASCDADLSGITDSMAICDWEGRSVLSDGFNPSADNVYFISGAKDNAFSYLESSKGDKVYNGAVLYSDNEKNKAEANDLKGCSSAQSLFNHETGEIYSNTDAEWNDLTRAWGSTLNGKFAVHSDANGFECVVKADNNISGLASAKLVVGIDTFANGIQSDVVEITANIQNGACTVTKTAVPNIGGDLPFEDFAGKGEIINGASALMTVKDNSVYYCVYITNSQLYPYFYSENGDVHMGLQFTGYNSSGGGMLQYNWGGSYSAGTPGKFGTISIKNAQ